MTEITVTEFRRDLKKYAELVKQEDILVLNNGRPVMMITDPMKDKIRAVKALRGIAKGNEDPEEILKERLKSL